MKLTYHKNLDGIRAIAALMVMIFHFFLSTPVNSSILKLFAKISIFGQTGVTLFFVLSGFLITRILIHTKNKEGYFKNFYLRRTLRIFPLYYLYLLLSYFVFPLLFSQVRPAIGEQVFFYTYLQNFAMTFSWNASGPGHFWSLAVEEHFYLFWPLLVYLVSRKNLQRIIIGIILFALLLRVYMINNGYEVFYFTFTRFDSLAIGALLALMELKSFFVKEKAKRFLLLLGIIFIPTISMWVFFTGKGNHMIQIFKFLLLGFTYFAILGFVLCQNKNNFLNKILESKFFSYTGRISYGLYVYHPFAFELSKEYMGISNFWIDLIFSFCLAYLISAISFHLFESVFLKLKKYFEYKK